DTPMCCTSPTSASISFFFQAEDGIRDGHVTGVQTCALPIFRRRPSLIRIQQYRFSASGTADGEAIKSIPATLDQWKRFDVILIRSEERRVGKECRSRWLRCY